MAGIAGPPCRFYIAIISEASQASQLGCTANPAREGYGSWLVHTAPHTSLLVKVKPCILSLSNLSRRQSPRMKAPSEGEICTQLCSVSPVDPLSL